MFVLLGLSLLAAGIVISVIGMGEVFVKEDLQYMKMTPDEIQNINERLIPLIAHDRAGFGGALVAVGLLLLLLSLWGFREGEKWVWWTFLVGGLPGFAAGIGTHYKIGYVDWWHLLPAFVALVFYVAGLLFSYGFLCRKVSRVDESDLFDLI